GLQQHALAHACRAQQNARLPRAHCKTDVIQNGGPAKCHRNAAEFHYRFCACGLLLGRGCGSFIHRLKMDTITVLIIRSTKMINTDANTTALMVDWPTPCVPPVVRMP